MTALPKIVKMESSDQLYNNHELKFFITNDGDTPLFKGHLTGTIKHKDGTISSFIDSVSLPDGGLMKGQLAKSSGYTTRFPEDKDREISIHIDKYDSFPLDVTATRVSILIGSAWKVEGAHIKNGGLNIFSFMKKSTKKSIVMGIGAILVFILAMYVLSGHH